MNNNIKTKFIAKLLILRICFKKIKKKKENKKESFHCFVWKKILRKRQLKENKKIYVINFFTIFLSSRENFLLLSFIFQQESLDRIGKKFFFFLIFLLLLFNFSFFLSISNNKKNFFSFSFYFLLFFFPFLFSISYLSYLLQTKHSLNSPQQTRFRTGRNK